MESANIILMCGKAFECPLGIRGTKACMSLDPERIKIPDGWSLEPYVKELDRTDPLEPCVEKNEPRWRTNNQIGTLESFLNRFR